MNFLCALALLCATTFHAIADEAAPFPTHRTLREVEGWSVRVDDRLLEGESAALGTRAIALLSSQLVSIVSVVAPDRLERLRLTSIVLDLTCGKLDNMQYHPSPDWLRENGFSPELAKCVHIPMAGLLVDPRHNHEQPWCVLHELAHAFHDGVFGFEDAKIKQAWERFCESGHGTRVLHINGSHTRHYALTNQQEFFAEMSEAYFGANDFFPFNNAELKEAEPEAYALLRDVWGPLIK